MANLAAPAPQGKSSVFALNVAFQHDNGTTVDDFLAASASQLGKKDLSRPLKMLSEHWVDTVGDLRLLIQEGQLRSLGLPLRLCVWMEEELSRVDTSHPNANAVQASYSEIKAGPQGFVHKFDMDTNGILYYIGTEGLTKPWQNPSEAGFVKITTSGLLHDSVPIHAVVGRETVRCVTKSHANAWFAVDLVDKYAAVSQYTLRHYSSWDTECVRSWRFEGSNDGIEWHVLREHKDDDSLNGQGSTFTWNTEEPHSQTAFRMFRVIMTGPNSNNHLYLALSGMELYGRLDDKPSEVKTAHTATLAAAPASSSGVQKFVPVKGGDTNGVLYYLGTNLGKDRYANPMTIGHVKVQASSLMHDSAPASSFVGRKLVRCVTKSVAGSFFIVDFCAWQIAPTHYMLRHYSSWDTEALRSWRFEGSKDGSTWTTLTEHSNDTNLNKKGGYHIWPVPLVFHNKWFRYFRVYQTGQNSNNHFYLACSGFELYGEMRASPGSDPATFAMVADEKAVPSGQVGQPIMVTEPTDFKYTADFDGKGIIAFIATQGFQQRWQNPATMKWVRVSASSVMHDSEPISHIVGNEVVRCVTKPHQNSWFCIDIINKYVIPTHYTLRHYSTWDVEALRNWNFEASNDGINWDILRRHVNDQSLKTKGGTFTWDLPSTGKSYQMFRILQWGPNSNKHNYLALSGFEVYGRLQPQPSELVSEAKATSGLAWDPDKRSSHISISRAGDVALNEGSNDKWQMVRSKTLFTRGVQTAAIKIARDTKTTNTWRFIIGVIPASFPPTGGKEWVGAMGSWGYIAGTGGCCHAQAKSIPYGAPYGEDDVIGIRMDFDRNTLEFFKNGAPQHVAFDNLVGPVSVACSFTGKNAQIKLVEFQPIVQSVFRASPWDAAQVSRHLVVEEGSGIVSNKSVNNKWQSLRGRHCYTAGKHSFSVKILSSPATPNQWKFIVGLVTSNFPLTWVGAAGSWGYIAGTGGRVHDVGKSIGYGAPWGDSGDVITVTVDLDKKTIEFFKNGASQGLAFRSGVEGPLYPALSMTATGSQVQFLQVDCCAECSAVVS